MDCKIVFYCCYIIVVLGMLCQLTQVAGVNIQINPQAAVREPNSTQLLTFSCSVNEGNIRTVVLLVLQKAQSNADPIALAQYIPDTNAATALDFNPVFKNTAITRGFVLQFTGTAVAPAFTMSVLKTNITCWDQGQYICQLIYLTSQSKAETVTNSANLTVYVPPKINSLEAYRDRVDGTRIYDGSSKNTSASLSVGSTVYLKCRADIGTDSNVKVSWRVSSAYNADSFDQYSPNTNMYSDGTVVAVNSCEYTRDAVLMYNISSIDVTRNYDTMLCIGCYVSSTSGGSIESSPFCVATGFPSLPKMFKYIGMNGTMPVFYMEKGFSGGYQQWFVIELYTSESDTWIGSFAFNETDERYLQSSGSYIINIPGLKPQTYKARIIATNILGRTNVTDMLTQSFTIPADDAPTQHTATGPIIGGTLGAIGVIIVLVLSSIITL